ncbi:CLIP domain-containing serine protease HP8-like [Bombus vancouverensis nearcticus]|uniref:CLIP domain-containing serine protease HP8-like n=1 Tax=Bombus vancouverensis nearcticus TaxID=2705178 RepID=UPI002239D1CD
MIKLFAFGILQAMMLVAVAQFQGQSNCASLYGVSGQCIGLRQCPQILNILQTRPLPPQTIDILRQIQCGFDSPNNPRVCCPIQTRTEDNSRINSNSGQQNTNNENTNNQNTNNQNTNNQNTNNQNLQYDIFNNPLLPTECGKDLTQRIVGGERAGLDEYPWMTLLEYLTLNGVYTACGGVLISQRYVLTAAHCVKGKDIPSTWRLQSVRLGEYNTDTNPDCIKDDENSEICADETVSVEIEEQIAHENYRPRSRDQKYDIALLRLSRDVTFTNYIKPICLPPNASLGQRLSVAGWGKTENGSSSNIKLKLTLPIVDEVQCQMTYGNVGVALGYGQICAGGQKGKDSCRGDSGGSLMAVERDRNGSARWAAVGVVSFGPSPCGMPGWPGVYTRVIDFVPWILSKMRP